jgi:hypothetical protein
MNEIIKLKQMSLDIYNNKLASTFSAAETEEALRKEMNDMIKTDGKVDYYKYQANKWMIFQIISETVDAILPVKVLAVLDKYVDTMQVAQGDKIRFKLKKGAARVKNFVTKVGAGGNYEVAQLDSAYLDLTAYARGGGVLVEFERFLDGTDSLVDLYDALMEGMEYRIYMDIQDALKALTASVPANNYKTHAGFDATKMKALINALRAYGVPNLFCTPTFAASVTPDTNFIGDADKEDVRNQGYIGRYAGCNTILMPQSFLDETNVTEVLDNQYGYVIPSTENKVIKLAYEGQSIVEDVKNADGSFEFQIYKKFAIGTVFTNTLGIYKNTSL